MRAKSNVKRIQTDPQQVLAKMMKEPGLHEKIFKMFSQIKKEDSDDEDCTPDERTPKSLEQIENQKKLLHRL